MGRFIELLEKRRNLTADIFEEEELIELSKTMSDEQLMGVDKELLKSSSSERFNEMFSLLNKLSDVIEKSK